MFINDSGMRSLWTSLQDMERMLHDLHRGFEPATAAFADAAAPALNVWANEDAAVVTCDLPGLDPASLAISVTGDTLTLRGQRRTADEGADADGGRSYHRRERAQFEFSRSLQLPFRVDGDRAEARYELGVLTIALRRPESDKARRITVKSA